MTQRLETLERAAHYRRRNEQTQCVVQVADLLEMFELIHQGEMLKRKAEEGKDESKP